MDDRTRAKNRVAARTCAWGAAAVGAMSCALQGDGARAERGPSFERSIDVSVFQVGNLHTHSSRSDGDASPEEVFAWYRAQGSDFVALTDHNLLVDPRPFSEQAQLSLIAGEEITMTGNGRQVHVNGLCLHRAIAGGAFATPAQALQYAIDQVAVQGGVSLINHPNFDWGLNEVDLMSTAGAHLLEIASGHPYVRTDGGQGRKSHEMLWDVLLSAGFRIGPAAVDDAHHFKTDPPGEAARPGRAFVGVFAQRSTPELLCSALARGDLYASNGATVARFQVTAYDMAVTPSTLPARVQFLVQEGQIRQETQLDAALATASYQVVGDERYVRARVVDARNRVAWLPVVFVQQR